MKLDDVLSAVGWETERELIEPGWAESLACMPTAELPFLAAGFIREACAYVGLPRDLEDVLLRAAVRIGTAPALRALAWHAHCRMYRGVGGKSIGSWPLPVQALGNDAGLFYVLVLLSHQPQTSAFHQAHGIPSGVVADTMSDLLLHITRHRRKTGHYGIEALYAGSWLRHHMRGEIYRLGRLQFIPARFPAVCHVHRHRDGRVVALAAEGLEFRRDGQRNGASGIAEIEGVWKSTFTVTDREVVGHPIDPVAGKALRETASLARAEWVEALRPGDPVLDIHIPEVGPMPPEVCAESVRQAMEFFPRHFPEAPRPRALTCTSWLMDPQLEPYLPPTANVIQFLRQFYLYPVDCDAWAIFRFVFNLDIPYGAAYSPDLDALPQRSRLERAIVAHVRAGSRWRKAGGFLLVEDLPWGRQTYRNSRKT